MSAKIRVGAIDYYLERASAEIIERKKRKIGSHSPLVPVAAVAAGSAAAERAARGLSQTVAGLSAGQ